MVTGKISMKTLFLDTHNQFIIVILYIDGKVVEMQKKESSMQHSVYTMPLIQEILQTKNMTPEDLDEIIVVNGPGSFTGVRIGVTIAKTMAYLLTIPIKVINVLEEKALMVNENEKTVFEAEKNGKYVATFDKENHLIGEYKYFKNSDFENFCKENKVFDITEINYEKAYTYLSKKEPLHPHAVNPLYIKNIEVKK